MAVSLLDICNGIETTLLNNIGLRAFHYVPERIDPPAAIITLDSADVSAFKLGIYDLPMKVTVCTSTASDRAGQEELMGYVDFGSSTSVWRTLYNNSDFGLTGVSSGVLRYTPLGTIELAGSRFYAGAFDLRVVTSPGAA